ncbi:hypothetical protein, partial [uncultured Tateyamaria sp.]|uniref:hypothetical protein n=1 Tax=uncultured Tateyamaria sp. TaxID=455651 RepID=UPI002639DEC0
KRDESMCAPEIKSAAPSPVQQAAPDAPQAKRFKANLAPSEAASPKSSGGGRQQRAMFADATERQQGNSDQGDLQALGNMAGDATPDPMSIALLLNQPNDQANQQHDVKAPSQDSPDQNRSVNISNVFSERLSDSFANASARTASDAAEQAASPNISHWAEERSLDDKVAEAMFNAIGDDAPSFDDPKTLENTFNDSLFEGKPVVKVIDVRENNSSLTYQRTEPIFENNGVTIDDYRTATVGICIGASLVFLNDVLNDGKAPQDAGTSPTAGAAIQLASDWAFGKETAALAPNFDPNAPNARIDFTKKILTAASESAAATMGLSFERNEFFSTFKAAVDDINKTSGGYLFATSDHAMAAIKYDDCIVLLEPDSAVLKFPDASSLTTFFEKSEKYEDADTELGYQVMKLASTPPENLPYALREE